MSRWRKDKKARKEKNGWRREEQEWEGVLICDDSLEAQRGKKKSLFLTLSFTLLSCCFHFNDLFPHFPSSFQACCFLFVYLYINFFRDLSMHLVPVCFPVWVFVLFHVCPCIFSIFYACACFPLVKALCETIEFQHLTFTLCLHPDHWVPCIKWVTSAERMHKFKVRDSQFVSLGHHYCMGQD